MPNDVFNEFFVSEEIRVSGDKLDNKVRVGDGEKEMMNKGRKRGLLQVIRREL
jgi:hypothetical protein